MSDSMNNQMLYTKHEDEQFFKDELARLQPSQVEERFSSMLSFGTGGMRGVIGCGTNHINSYMVRRLSQAIANYLQDVEHPSMAIAYDSRHFSQQFALQAALVFTACNIKVYLFSALRGVPLLSFAVRQLKTSMGVMITASHNPPQYNGYKLYNSDGAQIVEPVDRQVMDLMAGVTTIKSLTEQEAINKGLLTYIGDDLDEAYRTMLAPLISRAPLISTHAAHFKIVYSALHGTGGQTVPTLLRAYGFDVTCVEEQQQPDGDFPTVKSPNPEDKDAFLMGVDLARKIGAQMVLATDPDSDRIGVATLHNGRYILLSGNQMGSLMLDYRCATLLENNRSIKDGYFVNTIVSSPLQSQIAHFYGLENFSVLTGFKNIASQIATMERLDKNFIFACEESYGMLFTDQVRDKDALSAALVLAECALYHHSEGRSLVDQVTFIFDNFGYFIEDQQSYTLEGGKGLALIEKIMDALRLLPPQNFNKLLTKKIDYLTDNTGLSASNVLEFSNNKGIKIMVRPSGTEPKIKFYLMSQDDRDSQIASDYLALLRESIDGFMKNYLVG